MMTFAAEMGATNAGISSRASVAAASEITARNKLVPLDRILFIDGGNRAVL